MDTGAADRIGRNYQDWLDFFRKGAGGFNPGAFIQGLMPKPAPITAPESPAPAEPEAAPAPAPAPTPSGEPPKPPTTLEEFRAQLQEARTALAAAEAVAKDENQPPDVRTRAAATATALRTGVTSILTQVAAEENRIRDEAKAAEKEKQTAKEKEEEKAKTQDATPKNGDTRTIRVERKGVTGSTTEKYHNGVWSYVENSFKPDAGPGNQPTPTRTIYTAGDGSAYWVDPSDPSKVSRIDGVGGKVSTVNAPDGSVWVLNPDGSRGQRLFEAAPESSVVNNTKVYTDKNTGQVIARIDLLDPAGRARADRLDALAERTAELGVAAAEQAAQPKFASAQAQYVQEAQRRQKLARTELDRLLKLQEEGQISPEQAQTQFDRWMGINVEGPLAGYERAAQQERQEQEQADLVRTNAERTRVDEYNTRRGQLAYEAGEAGRAQAIEIGKRTRAPEYIADVGRVAQSMATGEKFTGFSPGTFDVANYRKVVPNVQELADAAVERLLSRIGGPATARDVNVPRQPLPSGQDLMGLMDSVKYSGPMTGAPANEQPLLGQGAIDLEPQGRPGYARSVYSNDRYVDWPIQPTVAAP